MVIKMLLKMSQFWIDNPPLLEEQNAEVVVLGHTFSVFHSFRPPLGLLVQVRRGALRPVPSCHLMVRVLKHT